MLDLEKYTKMCQLKEKIEFLEAELKQGAVSYFAKIQRYDKQYKRLYQEISEQFNLPVNLNDYIHNIITYLEARNPDGGKWYYLYTELMHDVIEQEHFYGWHSYHNYKYKVELLNGDRVIPVCTVNRELDYANKKSTINLLSDTMFAPFSLRLDKTSDEFDKRTCKDLQKIYFKTYFQAQQLKVGQEMTLIQREIERLKQEYKEKSIQYKNLEKQLKDLKLTDSQKYNTTK